MREPDIIRIIAKAFGLYFLVLAALSVRDLAMSGIVALGQTVQDDQGLTYRYLLIGYGFNIVYNFLASFILIFKARPIAKTIAGSGSEKIELVLTKTNSIELIIIAISALVILQAIPELLTRLTNYAYFNPNDDGLRNGFWEKGINRDMLIFAAFKLITGLMAITNARVIAGKLVRIGDRDEATDEVANDRSS